MSYFSNFPTMTYANVAVVDLTRRVYIPDSVLRQPTAFAPYTVPAGQRDDTTSFLYYGQDDDDWLIWLANQIVDPYYGWYLDDDQLAEFAAMKYGTLVDSMLRVDHWLCNWASDDTQITPARYSDLTQNLQKYWIPVYGGMNQILSYRRRQEDWIVSTNRLIDLDLSSGEGMEKGDLVTVYDPDGNRQGTGELVWVSGNRVRVKDVQGDWEEGYAVKTVSSTATVTNLTNRIDVIPIDEIVYFTPVTSFDAEYDRNEENKEVLLIQDAYRGIMYTELKNLLGT